MHLPFDPQESIDPLLTDADRRRSPRQAFAANGWISPEAGTRGASRQVVVCDLSLHGVGFTSKETIEPGAVHWFILDAGGLRASSRIRIASCRPQNDAAGYFYCGAEFF